MVRLDDVAYVVTRWSVTPHPQQQHTGKAHPIVVQDVVVVDLEPAQHPALLVGLDTDPAG